MYLPCGLRISDSVRFAILMCGCGLFAFGVIAAASEKVIPGDFRGNESGGMNLYGNAKASAPPTGLGQLFVVPEGHEYLRRAGFLAFMPTYSMSKPPTSPGVSTRMLIRAFISEWNGDKPSRQTLWQSSSMELIKQNVEIPSFEWIWFDVPDLKLETGKKYIAWITTAGLENDAADTFGIIRMGASHGAVYGAQSGKSLYPEGSFVVWSQKNPEHSVDAMTSAAWAPDRLGANLHFKMHFFDKP